MPGSLPSASKHTGQVSLRNHGGRNSGSVITYGDSLLGIDLEHPADKILCIGGKPLRHRVLAKSDALKQRANVGMIERQSSGEECVKDNSARPDIGRRSVIVQTLNNEQVSAGPLMAQRHGRCRPRRDKVRAEILDEEGRKRTATISGLA